MTSIDDSRRSVVSAYASTFAALSAAVAGQARQAPDGTVLAFSGSPIASLNAIISPNLNPSPQSIADLVASVSCWDRPWSIHVRGEPTVPLNELAAQHGLTRRHTQPLMIRPASQGVPPRGTSPVRLRMLTANKLGLYAETMASGFVAPLENFKILADPAVADIPGVTHYLAEVDGQAVGTGMAALSGRLVGLFNIATLPEHRRRGYGRAITLEILRRGYARGASTGYLYASAMGAPVYAAAGFSTQEHLTLMTAA